MTDINNINNNALITYNNGADIITRRDVYNVLEQSAINHGLENGLKDLAKECSSSKFSVILKDVGNLFKSTKALIITSASPDSYIYNNNITWEYDKFKLFELVPLYIDICYEYDKRVSLDGFLRFCGIGGVNYFCYKEKSVELSENLRARLAEVLTKSDDENQKNKARDSQQPILQLAYNNYVHGWSGEIERKEITSTVKTLDDIKKSRLELSASDEQKPI